MKSVPLSFPHPCAFSFLFFTHSHTLSLSLFCPPFLSGSGLSCARPTIGARPSGRGTALIVEANAKRCLGSTKGGTNRHRKRTSGFRVRKRSATGSKVGGLLKQKVSLSLHDEKKKEKEKGKKFFSTANILLLHYHHQVLKNRRKKGRKQLAPASKHSGKK